MYTQARNSQGRYDLVTHVPHFYLYFEWLFSLRIIAYAAGCSPFIYYQGALMQNDL